MSDNPIDNYINWLKQNYKIEKYQEKHIRVFLSNPNRDKMILLLPKRNAIKTYSIMKGHVKCME